MANGRKFEYAHHDRLLGSFGYTPDQPTGADHSELAEEDVWSVINDGGTARRRSERRWPRAEDRQVGGLSLAFEDAGRASSRIGHQFRGPNHVATGAPAAASAPVNVPDWPKILRVDSVESMHDGYGVMKGGDDEEEWIPPHEYLAKSRRSEGHSVCEGAGRTLKGRDMSRVRNAVWSQTGFYG